MATVNLYFGAGGTDTGEACTSFATRTKSLTRLKAVMLASVTSADDVVLWGEGLITRETHTSWAPVSGIQLTINNTECIGRSLRLRSYSVLGGPETPLTFTDFYRYKNGGSTADWTDTGTTTTRGTKIWKTTTILNSGALNIGANGMGRVFAADFTTDPKFTVKELWEGGNNYNSTLGAAIHQNLDIIPGTDVPGSCWTLYNAAGVLDTYLYIACPVNPFTAFGVITLSSRGSSSILAFTSIPNLRVDPEVTTRGGGVKGGIALNSCGTLDSPALIECKVLNTNPYCFPMWFGGTFNNVSVAPWVDPEYKSVTPYYVGGTAHPAGANENAVHTGADINSATGWAENGGVPSITFKARASNGRASRICDTLHSGIAHFPPSVTGKFIRVEDGVEFDFSHVKYGRGIAFGNVELVDVGAIKVTSQPTYSQYTGGANSKFRMRGARFQSSDNIGNGVTSPWGALSDKLGTSGAFASYSKIGYPTGELLIEDCIFECQDGGLNLQTFETTAFGGKVRIMNNVFIRPSLLPSIPNLGARINNGVLAYIATYSAAALPDQIEFINNVAIGFGATPCPYINTEVSPSFVYLEPEDIPCSVNTGWTHFDTYDEFRQALSSGQLPHIKA